MRCHEPGWTEIIGGSLERQHSFGLGSAIEGFDLINPNSLILC